MCLCAQRRRARRELDVCDPPVRVRESEAAAVEADDCVDDQEAKAGAFPPGSGSLESVEWFGQRREGRSQPTA